MRNLLQAMQVLLSILLGVFLFVWLMYHGSGHNIPLQTDVTLGGSVGIIVVLLVLTGRNLKRYNNFYFAVKSIPVVFNQ